MSTYKVGGNSDNIANVVTSGLCTGCGTCAGVCPTQAIRMRTVHGLCVPNICEEECTRCGLCIKSCPGHSMDFGYLGSQIFGKSTEDELLGHYLKLYIGHSNDEEIRFNCSSGGIVTHLLVFALETGMIDGALVTRMKRNDPLKTESFIAKTRKEIVSASGSKYCPVAANEALRHITSEKGRFAVVGLPCHIHGIRKAEVNIRALRDNIALHVGLMCSHTSNYLGTELILEKLRISKKQVESIAYRGLGWPGSMRVRLKDGSAVCLPYAGKWNAYLPLLSSFFFTPMRCAMCPDETNELADMSVGDAWLPELKNRKNGESLVVTRNEKAERFLRLAQNCRAIVLDPIGSERARHTQADPLRFKKKDLAARLAITSSNEMNVPNFEPKPDLSFSLFSFMRNSFVLSNIKASEKTTLQKLLLHAPFPVLRLYYGIYKSICFF